MRNFIFLCFCSVFLVNCNKKSVLLPEVTFGENNKIFDFSDIYLFYDTNEKDSLKLNKNNLISTTNWLFHIDKRLPLKTVFPVLESFQKKRDKKSMHKNEKANNYFTTVNLNAKKFHFITTYNTNYILKDSSTINAIYIKNLDSVYIVNKKLCYTYTNKKLTNYLNQLIDIDRCFFFHFNKNMNFQDYITFKNYFNKHTPHSFSIVVNETIY